MSNKRGAKRRPAEKRPRIRGARLAAVLALCAVAAVAAATRSPSVRRAVGLAPLAVATAPQATPTPLTLAKEYVYAGGRLVATEEPQPAATPTPTPAPAGLPPTALVAKASFPTVDTARVELTWSAPASGPEPTGYVVERASVKVSEGAMTGYAQVGQPVTAAATPAAPYLDPEAVPGAVYLYRVKAAYGGGFSGHSNPDVATTFRYTGDDPLVGASQGGAASPVRAANLTELRAVIEAVRALAGLGAGVWKDDPAPLLRGRVLAAHFAELRTNLNPALAALGMGELPEPAAAGVADRQPVRAAHVQDVRDKIR